MRHDTQIHSGETGGSRHLVAGAVSLELVPSEAQDFAPDPAVFPEGSRVFLTHIAGKPLAAQRDAARRLADLGYRPVPHLGARNFASVADYAAHLEALGAAGVEEALLVGGNPDRPAGTLNEASDLLVHPAVQGAGIRVAHLAAHPEGHPVASAEQIDEAMLRKLELCAAGGLAPAVVSQFAFEGRVIGDWLAGFRAAHPQLPVRVGLAGVTSLPKLIGYARRCGVGASIAALTGGPSRILGLMRDRDPGDVVDALEKTGVCADSRLALHVFTFGNWRKTLDWIARRRAT